MKTIFRVLVAVLLLGGWGVATSALHIVLTPGHVIIVPKDRLGLSETFADARAWSLPDAAAHPQIVARLIATHNADALMHVTKASSYDDLAQQLAQAVKETPKVEAATKPVEHARKTAATKPLAAK